MCFDCVSCVSDGLCVCSFVPLVVLCVFHLLRFVCFDPNSSRLHFSEFDPPVVYHHLLPERLENWRGGAWEIAQPFRRMHTLKGAAVLAFREGPSRR